MPGTWQGLVQGPELVDSPGLIRPGPATPRPRPGRGFRLPRREGAVPAPAVHGTRRLAEPLAVGLLVDASYSMESSDPAGLRYTEAHWAIRRLAHDRDLLFQDTATAVAFAEQARALGPLPLHQASARRRLKGFLKRPPKLPAGTTRLGPAVNALAEAFEEVPTGSRRLVLLISDGEVFDEEEVRDLLERLAEAEVHLLAADYGGFYTERAAAAWAEAPLASTSLITKPTKGQLAAALAAVIDQALGR